ncbi:MAG TPA: TolC family protein [Desulfuromonadales bacterium]|nr:TolC family protein [Desulfuromonadales bacterium]
MSLRASASRIFLCALCVLCGEKFSYAAEIRTLTLDQAISIAMEKNRDIEKAREYSRYVQGKYVEERSAALPQIGLYGTMSLSKDESQRALAGSSQRQTGTSLDLTLSQPLFTWGKLSAAIRAAEVGLKTADEQLRLYRQAARRDTATAWYDILLAKELHRLARENQLQKQRHQDEARRKFAAGIATDYDVLAAEVAAENAVPEVIRSENAIRLARERLRFLLAESGDVDAVGSLDRPTIERQLPLEYDEALQIACKKRPELSDVRLRIGIYDELVTIAAADNKPRLDLKGGAGWRWMALDDPAPRREADGAAWNVGVYMSFPFFDGLKSSGRVTQARSDLSTKQIDELKLRDSIALEVRNASDNLREAAEIYQAVSGTVRQAEKLLQMAEKGYEFGVKIRLEVDDAQLNLLQATSSLARAQRDYRVARINYDWVMGTLGE